jgi:hypothetical protein
MASVAKSCQEPFYSFFLFAIALLAIGGCGSAHEIPRAIVEGTVTFNGKPIKNGQISFHPIEGTRGPVAAAPIADGKYIATNKGGVPIGKHQVIVKGYEAPPPGSDPDAGAVQFVPGKFNRKSELTAEIPSGESTVVRNFDLPL